MDKVSVVPIWILFPGLDPYLWSDVVLSKMASKIGKPLFADKTTTCKGRLSFARVMVEADVATSLPDHVWINTSYAEPYAQRVEYEWVPYYCKECGKLGHLVDTCRQRIEKMKLAEQARDREVAKNTVATDQVLNGAASKPAMEVPDGITEGSGCKVLGGTSDPGVISASQTGVEADSGCVELGRASPSLIQAPYTSEAVMHSGWPVLGPPSPHLNSPFSLARRSGIPGLVNGGNAPPFVTSNSFDAIGCNNPLKLKEVSDFLAQNNMDVFGLLETRIKVGKALKTLKAKFGSYRVFHNYDKHVNGRIWVLWNPRTVAVNLVDVHDQVIHVQVQHHGSGVQFGVSVVYASNDALKRESLWASLCRMHSITKEWVILGDFNVVRDIQERVSTTLPNLSDILAFNQCVLQCELEDLQSQGCEYTWTKKQEGGARVCYKLDRVMANASWVQRFSSSVVSFLPAGISDHSPAIGTVFDEQRHGSCFSYLDCWSEDPDFHKLVSEA
ncbi:hypothetical protein RND81_11G116500 [Saponaria officinalis]|uniref:CCHC-type domain-containing protein n=1 Tax=Saponaria officinalis TaxID=3572 RepID=A0AAW1HJW3_SAPOF